MGGAVAAVVRGCPAAQEGVVAGAIVVVAEGLRERDGRHAVTGIGGREHGRGGHGVTGHGGVHRKGLDELRSGLVGHADGLTAADGRLVSAVVDGRGRERPREAEAAGAGDRGVVVGPGHLHVRGGTTAVVRGDHFGQTEGIDGEVGAAVGVRGEHGVGRAGDGGGRRGVVVQLDELLEHVGVSAIVLEGVRAHEDADRLDASTAERGVEEGDGHLASTFVHDVDEDVVVDHCIVVVLAGHLDEHLAEGHHRGDVVEDRDRLVHIRAVPAVVHKGPCAVDHEGAGARLGIDAVLFPAPGHIGVEVVRGGELAVGGGGVVFSAGQGHVGHLGHRTELVDQGDGLLAAGGVVAEVVSREGPREGHRAFGLVVIPGAVDHEVGVGPGDVDLLEGTAVVKGRGHAEGDRGGVVGDVHVEREGGVVRAGDDRGFVVVQGDVLLGHGTVATVVLDRPDPHPAAWADAAERPGLDGDGEVVVAVVEGLEGHLRRVGRVGEHLTGRHLVGVEGPEFRSRLVECRDGLDAGHRVAHIAAGIHGPGVEGPLEAEAAVGASIASVTERRQGPVHVELEGGGGGVAAVLGDDGRQAEEVGAELGRAGGVQHHGRVGRALKLGDHRSGHVDHGQDLRAGGLRGVAAVVRADRVEGPRDDIGAGAVGAGVVGCAVLDRVAEGRSGIAVVRAGDGHLAGLGGVEFTLAVAIELHHDVGRAGDVDGRGHRVDHQDELVRRRGVAAGVDHGVGDIPGRDRGDTTAGHGLAVDVGGVDSAVVRPGHEAEVHKLVKVAGPLITSDFRLRGAERDDRGLGVDDLNGLDAHVHGRVAAAVHGGGGPLALDGVAAGGRAVSHHVRVRDIPGGEGAVVGEDRFGQAGHVGRQVGGAEGGHRDLQVTREGEVDGRRFRVHHMDELDAEGLVVEQVNGGPGALQRVAGAGRLVDDGLTEVGHDRAARIVAVVGGGDHRQLGQGLSAGNCGVRGAVVKQRSGLVEAADLLLVGDGTTAVVEHRVEVGDAGVAFGRDDVLEGKVGDHVAQGTIDLGSIDLSLPGKPTAKSVFAVVVVGTEANLEAEVSVARGVVELQQAALEVPGSLQVALVALEHVDVPLIEWQIAAGVDVLESLALVGPIGAGGPVFEDIEDVEGLVGVELVGHASFKDGDVVGELGKGQSVSGLDEVIGVGEAGHFQAVDADGGVRTHSVGGRGGAHRVRHVVGGGHAGDLVVFGARAGVECGRGVLAGQVLEVFEALDGVVHDRRIEGEALGVAGIQLERVAVTVEADFGVGAGAIFVRRVFVIVAGLGISTAGHFLFVAQAVAIGVGQAVAVAVEVVLGRVGAEAVVRIGRVGVVVAGQFIAAARDLGLVADAVAIGVVEAFTIAVVVIGTTVLLRVHAGARDGGVLVVVAGGLVHAALDGLTREVRQVGRIVERTEFSALLDGEQVEVELVQRAVGGVKQVELDRLVCLEVNVHVDPGGPIEFEGDAGAHHEAISRGDDGGAHDGHAVQRHVGDQGVRDDGQDHDIHVGLVARIIAVAEAISVGVGEAVAITV